MKRSLLLDGNATRNNLNCRTTALSAVVNSSTLRPTAVHSSGLPNQVYLLTFLLPGKLPIISHKFPMLCFIYARKIDKARGKMVDKLFTTNKENVIINVTIESLFLLQYLSCAENLVEKISVDRVAKYRSFASFKNYFIAKSAKSNKCHWFPDDCWKNIWKHYSRFDNTPFYSANPSPRIYFSIWRLTSIDTKNLFSEKKISQ